jgi:hypothetical protein
MFNRLGDAGMFARLAIILSCVCFLSACSSLNLDLGSLMPSFGNMGSIFTSKPTNTGEYVCEGGKRVTERQLRLERKGEARYVAGNTELTIAENKLNIEDPPARYTGCTAAQAAAK